MNCKCGHVWAYHTFDTGCHGPGDYDCTCEGFVPEKHDFKCVCTHSKSDHFTAGFSSAKWCNSCNCGDFIPMIPHTPEDPQHYKLDLPGGLEVKDLLKAQGVFKEACEANVIKYVFRWKRKNGLEDLKKAYVNLGWLIEEIESE